jgi:RNA 3'-terminal phosphate cyclase
MKMMGVELTISDIKKGYYPKGFGYIVFNVKAL